MRRNLKTESKNYSKRTPNRVPSGNLVRPPSAPELSNPSSFEDDQHIVVRRPEESKAQTESTQDIQINLKSALDHIKLNPKESREVPNYLEIESIEQCNDGGERPGIDLVAVIDNSGSMRTDKIELVKATLEFMVTQLGDSDRLCLVEFNNQALRLCPLTVMNERGKTEVNRIIRNVQAGGGTNIQDGLEIGMRVLADRRIENNITSLLLMSDGQDNESSTILERSHGVLENYCPKIRSGFTIHTFGYGAGHDAQLLDKIADMGSGGFYYVENNESIGFAFANCLGELMSVVADEINVILNLQPCGHPVQFSKIYSDNGDCSFKVQALVSGAKKQSVFVLKYSPSQITEDQRVEPVKATVTYKLASTGEVKTKECQLSVVLSSSDQPEAINQDVMVHFYRAKTADVLKQASELADQNQFQQAKSIVLACSEEIKRSPVSENEVIKALIEDLAESARGLESRSSWESGGKACVKSAHRGHMNQRSAKKSVYQNVLQKKANASYEVFMSKR